MGTYKLILKRRTIRVFQDKPVPFSSLKKCVNAARLSPSARNVQELEFLAVNGREQVARVNEAVRFGGIVREKGRVKGEEPKAFIAILAEKEKSSQEYTPINAGIAAEAIVLTALEQGIGSCIMGAIERERIKGILGVPNSYAMPLVIALGYPKEKPVAGKPRGKDMFYWTEKGQLHVPKRHLEEVMHRDRF
ncbi:MAG: nitroreductase family protein [Candidatus Diapherotrites archaeon]|uniref:Nitroreductase family protein n=1 Tax=Candidatus Iainarchaeum sp. TaxID=3101447 RepID=A0A939C4C4_9ARCH|nr:nitroreductase family protein [Candidatus Diapherotrites archaeon]